MSPGWIEPDWPVPPGVCAATTLRFGGVSEGDFASFNLAAHVGDDPERVAENRRLLSQTLDLPGEPFWLQQVHGNTVMRAESTRRLNRDDPRPVADASHTGEKGVVCVVMTADCLPVLLCSAAGESVAAVHAGWRGLAGGVIEATAKAMDSPPSRAWLGPALGPDAFEVGSEVREIFLARDANHARCFRPHVEGKWWADLYGLARLTLNRLGIRDIYGGHFCTALESERFFSYRKNKVTGRMATLIWRE